jgi:hypothetical protein
MRLQIELSRPARTGRYVTRGHARIQNLSVRQRQDHVVVLRFSSDEDEQRWDHLFAVSSDVLADLAAEALADLESGRTEPLDPDRL